MESANRTLHIRRMIETIKIKNFAYSNHLVTAVAYNFNKFEMELLLEYKMEIQLEIKLFCSAHSIYLR